MIRRLKPLRKSPLSLLLVFALTVLAGPVNAEADNADAITGAMKTLDKWMAAFNARNLEEWAATVHYPMFVLPVEQPPFSKALNNL